jgi:hypothetical protein
MAQKDLDKLATNLINKLYRNSSEFREAVTSRQIHQFKINAVDLRKSTRQELRNILGYTGSKALPREFENVIKREAPKVTKTFYDSFKRASMNSKTFNVKK